MTDEQRELARERNRRYRETHRDEINARNRARRVRAPAKVPLSLEEKRERQREAGRRWTARNPEKIREKRRRPETRETQRRWKASHPERMMVARHGMWPEDLMRMFNEQQGKCYLCRELLPADSSKWNIDHDHRCPHPRNNSCGRCRRGLAHRDCNVLIGMALDDPDMLRRIADNLEVALAEVSRRLIDKPQQSELIAL